VFTLFADALRAQRLLAGLLKSAEVDRERLACRAAADFMTVTELADTLVRQTGMSFREAHALVSKAVKAAGEDDSPRAIAAALLAESPSVPLTQSEIERALDPRNFVNVRRVAGGPAPEIVAEALSRARNEQVSFEHWIQSKQEMLQEARRRNLGA
jgi:argininosuccinate lyase